MRCARHLILALGVLACLVSAEDYTEREILDGIQEEFDEIQGSLDRLMNTAIPTTTTEGSTTVGSTTIGSSTGSSTTGSSTTVGSTTGSSTTVGSTTGSSTNVASTTGSSTTVGSTTVGSTTGSSTTVGSTTGSSMTGSSTTVGSTTGSSTTGSSTTVGSTTGSSTTVGSTTGSSTTVGSTTGSSTTVGSTTGSSTTVGSTTGSSTNVGSTTGSSTTVGSTTVGSTTGSSTTVGSTTGSSMTGSSTTVGSTTASSTTVGSTTGGPTSSTTEEKMPEVRQQNWWHPEAVLQEEVEWQKKEDLEWKGKTGWRRMLWADEDLTDEDELENKGLCMLNTSNPDDLCGRLVNVTQDIQKVADEVAGGEATVSQWESLKVYSEELEGVVNESLSNPTFIDNLNDTVLREEFDQLEETIMKAEVVVNEKIKELDDGGDDSDDTLAIVLGTLGGILGVALIGAGGYVFYQRRKKNKAGDHGRGSTSSSEVGGRTNPLVTTIDE